MSQEQPPVQPTASSSSTIPAPLPEFKLWNPPANSASSSSSQSRNALPDEFFQPTAAEMTSALASQTRAREALLNAPLKTQAIREKEERAKLQRWPQTTIRVKFPNQMMLESTFPSSSGIKAVYAFVRNSLTEEAKPNKFVLFQVPPRRELKVSDPKVKTQTLAQLQLAPSSVLHFEFLEEHLNNSTQIPPLLPEILAAAADLPPPPTFDKPPAKEDTTEKIKAAISAPSEKLQKFFKFKGKP
jgi:tether containing UBX domain for GLUT4